MGLENLVDNATLEVSAIVSSCYLCVMTINLLQEKEIAVLQSQAFAFLVLFFIAALVRIVI